MKQKLPLSAMLNKHAVQYCKIGQGLVVNGMLHTISGRWQFLHSRGSTASLVHSLGQWLPGEIKDVANHLPGKVEFLLLFGTTWPSLDFTFYFLSAFCICWNLPHLTFHKRALLDLTIFCIVIIHLFCWEIKHGQGMMHARHTKTMPSYRIIEKTS